MLRRRGFCASIYLALLWMTCPEDIRAADAIASEMPVVQAGDWPWWRGPNCDGLSQDADVPLTWSTTEHVRWKSPISGRGHSSPIVCGDRIYLTTADQAEQKQRLLCYERNSGKLLWDKVVHDGNFMHAHEKNSSASATCAYDGSRIFCVFINDGALWVTAFDPDGNMVWQSNAGPFVTQHGYGPSPVIYKSFIIVSGDSAGKSFLAAFERANGKIAWNTPRRTVGDSGNYATPILAHLAGKPQLLLTGQGRLVSYNPDNGEQLWSCKGPSRVAACTAAFGDDMVFTSGGHPEKELMAVRADGTGDISATHVVWRTKKGVTYVPSPIFRNGRLYVVNDGGVAHCHNAATGEVLWEKRLDGEFTASPVIAGDKIFFTNEAGMTHVIRESAEFEQLAANDLGSPIFASPVICGGQIFLRTAENLYCIGK